MNDLPLVSIICTSYNHETFIAQAIEGFLIQKTTFPFEIIVHDDASTDNTANIVRSYEAKYPELFANIYQTENQYSKGKGDVARIIFSAARGKYIALCEGDDYWTDQYKLQKQIEFLDANPEYLLVYTDFDSYSEFRNKLIPSDVNENSINNDGYIFENLLKQNFIGTLTAVIRRSSILEAFDSIKSVNKDWKMGDYPLWLEISTKGKIGYINNSTAVYRLSGNSLSSHSDYLKFMEFTLSAYDVRKYFINAYPCPEDLKKAINISYCKLLLEYCFLTQNGNHLNKIEIKNAFNELRVDRLYIGYRFHIYYLGTICNFFRPALKIVLKIFYPQRLMSLRG